MAEGLFLLSSACNQLSCVCWEGEEVASRTGAGHGSWADVATCGIVKFWRGKTWRHGKMLGCNFLEG